MRERLYRSRSDRMLFGVAGGMADWLDLDPALVRLVWALLILAGGVGLLLYIVAAIVIPEEPPGRAAGAAAAAVSGAGNTQGAAAPGAAVQDDDWFARRAARRASRGRRNDSATIFIGLALVLVGAWFLIGRFVHIDSELVLPAILIVLGAALVVGALARSGGQPRH